MSEVAFTKQFLTALSSRPLKLNPDYAEDPKTHHQRLPVKLQTWVFIWSPSYITNDTQRVL